MKARQPDLPWMGGLAGAGAILFAVCALAMLVAPVRADDTGAGVGRISLLRGDVTVQRGDSGDTVAAIVNAPVSAGDYVSTSGSGSRAEIELDASDVVRVAGDSQLRVTQLDQSQEAVQLAAGTIALRMFKVAADPQIDTPSITIRPNEAGSYRVSVADDGTTTFTVRSGSADLLVPQGTRTIDAGLTVVISGTSVNPHIRPAAVLAYDGFDAWNAQRDDYAQQAYDDQYVNPGVVGAADLDAYGHWVVVANYGQVWVPYTYALGPGWAPYHDGRWVWEPYYGWTWVGYEPWGWAPYHYGRWFYAQGYGWAWYPGPVYVRPVYRPALVAFFSFGGGGNRFDLAFGNIGWVPVGPWEPYHPWWGPGIVNRTVVNVNLVDVTRIYHNAVVYGGVAVVSHQDFIGGGSYHYLATRPEELHKVSLAKSSLPISPTHQSYLFAKTDSTHATLAAPLSPNFRRLPQEHYTAAATATSHRSNGNQPHGGKQKQVASKKPGG